MKKTPLFKIVVSVIIGLLMPVLSYTIYQFIQSNKNEELIKSIYDRQLETILFSVNQNSWDVFNSWVSEISTNVEAVIENKSLQNLDSVLAKFVAKQPSVIGITLKLSDQYVTTWSRQKNRNFLTHRLWDIQKFESMLSKSEKDVLRMIRRAREGYISPIAVRWRDDEQNQISLLVFPIIVEGVPSVQPVLAGIFLDDLIYVNEIVARKFEAINDGTFVFAVGDRIKSSLLYSTEEEISISDFEKSARLWILPDLDVLIKLSGTTLEDVSKTRSRINLVFLVILNLLLIAGSYYLVRNVLLQMKLAKMQTDFVANVSHELRTPLAVIRMFAETLEMGRVKSDERKLHYYRSIMNESTRLTQLINNILDFSKIESKKKNYNLVPVKIEELVRETLDMYQFHLKQEGFQLEYNSPTDLPEIKADPEALKQALLNLLENALKFSLNEKKIVVSLKHQNNQIELSVQDFGIGIPESEQKKIFEKFYRASNVYERQAKGSGLGLVLVKNIMDMHGGKIKVKSKPGKGSTFLLIFPVKKTGEV